MPHLYLVDNTRPPDPTLPDLYDGAANDDEPWFDAVVRVGSRVWRMAFWVALGLCVGVMVL